jgi:hypothetical protein
VCVASELCCLHPNQATLHILSTLSQCFRSIREEKSRLKHPLEKIRDSNRLFRVLTHLWCCPDRLDPNDSNVLFSLRKKKKTSKRIYTLIALNTRRTSFTERATIPTVSKEELGCCYFFLLKHKYLFKPHCDDSVP